MWFIYWVFLSRLYKGSLQSLLLWCMSPAPQPCLLETTSVTGFSASSRLRQIQDMVSLIPFHLRMIEHGTPQHEWLCPRLCLRTTPAYRVPHSFLSPSLILYLLIFFAVLGPYCCTLLSSGFGQWGYFLAGSVRVSHCGGFSCLQSPGCNCDARA